MKTSPPLNIPNLPYGHNDTNLFNDVTSDSHHGFITVSYYSNITHFDGTKFLKLKSSENLQNLQFQISYNNDFSEKQTS